MFIYNLSLSRTYTITHTFMFKTFILSFFRSFSCNFIKFLSETFHCSTSIINRDNNIYNYCNKRKTQKYSRYAAH